MFTRSMFEGAGVKRSGRMEGEGERRNGERRNGEKMGLMDGTRGRLHIIKKREKTVIDEKEEEEII